MLQDLHLLDLLGFKLPRNYAVLMKFQDSYKFINILAGKIMAYGGLFIIFNPF